MRVETGVFIFLLGAYPGFRSLLQHGPIKPAVRVIPQDQAWFDIVLVSY